MLRRSLLVVVRAEWARLPGHTRTAAVGFLGVLQWLGTTDLLYLQDMV